MSQMRKLGKREREARKRLRRARVSTGAVTGWLKLGRKHLSRWTWTCGLAVADSRQPRILYGSLCSAYDIACIGILGRRQSQFPGYRTGQHMLEPVGPGLMRCNNKTIEFYMAQKGKIRHITPQQMIIKSYRHYDK